MDLRRSTIGQALMWPFLVLELEVASAALCEGRDGGVVLQGKVFLRD